jgi:hypothetical protein
MSAINPAYRASRHQKDGDRHGEGKQPRREKARSVDRARAPGAHGWLKPLRLKT